MRRSQRRVRWPSRPRRTHRCQRRYRPPRRARRIGGGIRTSIDRALGYGHVKLGVSARLLVATTKASLLSAVQFMCDLSRS
jgi:hypothetical protein